MNQTAQERPLRRALAPVEAAARAATRMIERRPLLARWLLAGPGALLAAVATMMAMPVWLPAGAAGVNNLAFPILLAPALWAVPFFYAVLDENLPRVAAVLAGATILQGGVAVRAMLG